ncbi:hypothetical protein [Micromonospora sp. LOL_021]|uniref:hypothetical protein n=1 Tax=Micromonospora sp. LOL_021 TaxID=3345417 RepID=UPI003A8B531D
MHGIDLPGPDRPTVRSLGSRAGARDRVRVLQRPPTVDDRSVEHLAQQSGHLP